MSLTVLFKHLGLLQGGMGGKPIGLYMKADLSLQCQRINQSVTVSFTVI